MYPFDLVLSALRLGFSEYLDAFYIPGTRRSWYVVFWWFCITAYTTWWEMSFGIIFLASKISTHSRNLRFPLLIHLHEADGLEFGKK